MSFYSVGKNEICNLLEKEAKIKKQLKEMDKSNSQNEVCSFKTITLKNEISKIQNKLKVLSLGNSDNDDTA